MGLWGIIFYFFYASERGNLNETQIPGRRRLRASKIQNPKTEQEIEPEGLCIIPFYCAMKKMQ